MALASGQKIFQVLGLTFLCLLCQTNSEADARKLLGSASNRNVNFIDDPSTVASIDFSGAEPGPDGTVCVERKKYVDKTETDQLKECFVQNVTQCYYTYVTEYSEAEQEKCVDFYWKTCKIVFKERVFNATTRMCKRPLIKRCDDQPKYNAGSQEPKIVCETFFETACNTTDVIPAPGDEPLPVTFCDKIPRKICAPDNCRVEEAPEQCEESTDQSTIEHPIELCDLQPQKHCSAEKVSVPRLVPEQKCRKVEKEICNTQLVNPHDTKKPVFIKYCAKRERVGSSAAGSYLPPQTNNNPPPPPPPPPVYTPRPQPASSSYGGPPPPLPPVSSSPSSNSYTRNPFNRAKRDPNLPVVIEAGDQPRVIESAPIYNNNLSPQPKAASWTATRHNARIDSGKGSEQQQKLSKRASRSLKHFEASQKQQHNSNNNNRDYQPWSPVERNY